MGLVAMWLSLSLCFSVSVFLSLHEFIYLFFRIRSFNLQIAISFLFSMFSGFFYFHYSFVFDYFSDGLF